ncbi:MAG: TonB-dependent receptor [Pseudomonadota bacterium]
MRNLLKETVASIVVCGLMATPALAQDTESSIEETSRTLDTIVVSAQKRDQNLQDVPVAVSVLSNSVIESKFSNNIESLQTLVPSVSFRKGSTSANSALSIRGIGTVSFSLAAEPAVSTVVDGVVLGRSGQAFTDLYDIERIEVLRGPQGTLYGKNAQAGVINIVTQSPGDTFEGYVDASYFEDNEWKLRGKIAGPLTEELSGSLILMKSSFDGHITNVFNNEKVNGYDRFGMRGVLFYKPTNADFDLRLIYEHTEADDDCCADLEVLPSGRNPASLAAPNSNGVVNGVADLDLDQRRVDHDLTTETIDTTDAFSVEFNSSAFAGLDFTSITAYRRWENTEIREGDFTSIGGSSDQPVFGVPFLLHDDGTRTWQQVSQELRLSSPDSDSPLFWQIGAYVLNLDVEADFTRLASCQNNGGQNQPILDVNPGLTCNANDLVSATGFFDNNFRNYAIFGQAEYDVTDWVTGIFGARLTSDEISFDYVRRNNDPFGRQGVGVRPAEPNSQFSEASGGFDNRFTGDTENDNFSIKAGLRANVAGMMSSDDNLGSVYFTYAQGYKGPGFNTFYNMGTNDTLPIDPEESDSFEVGYKYNGGRFLLNAALYTAEIDGFQANNFDNSTGVTITRLTNAGTVETQGLELDLQWFPTEELTLTASAAFNDATIKEFNCPVDPTTGTAPANCTTRSGLDLFFSPDVNYTLGWDYERPLANGKAVFFNGSFAHIDEQNSLLPGTDGTFSPNSLLPDYDLLDASLGISLGDGAYRVAFVGKNLLDESFVTTFSGDGFRYQIPREADRYFGINLRASFD